VAGSAAQFSTPGVNIGLFCSTPMVALSRNVGAKKAMEMLLLGEMIPATEAFRLGLVNRLAQPGEAIEQALDMGRIIAAKSAVTLKIGKRAFYEQREMALSEAYDYASRVMAENMMARDAEEGIAAFIEKRTPHWQG
jgi:enoyl-CoA hydratase/carnithine racemase